MWILKLDFWLILKINIIFKKLVSICQNTVDVFTINVYNNLDNYRKDVLIYEFLLKINLKKNNLVVGSKNSNCNLQP